MVSPLIESLRRAVMAAPDDVALRLHLAQQLADAGERDEAVQAAAEVLRLEPSNTAAIELIARSTTLPQTTEPQNRTDLPPAGFDWSAAEREVDGIAGPAFVTAEPEVGSVAEAEPSQVLLADVAGLESVKERLQAAFLAPLQQPELRKLYGKSLRGGLLLYGPPGCGKTFIARAVAGELGAKFMSVGIADILDPMLGVSEQNVQLVFERARLEAPCVLFFDEIDALGQRRGLTRGSALRGTTNQLLAELDGVGVSNEGVFILAATNQPWDVDPALRRPGRFDRTLLVLPPDRPAREAIFRSNLDDRPVEGIDLAKLAAHTDGFSGADIAHICDSASELALLDSIRRGSPRLITMDDLLAAAKTIRPSIGAWLDAARNVVLYADTDGTYAELRSYLKRAKRL